MKRFKQAIVRPLGTFFLLALFCIFLRCSFHGWLHTIHQKCRPPSPPSKHFFSSPPFSLPSVSYLRRRWLSGSVLPYSRLQSFPKCQKSLVSFNFAPLTGPRGAVPASAQPYVTMVPSYKIAILRPTMPRLAVSRGPASPARTPFPSPSALPLFFPPVSQGSLWTLINSLGGEWIGDIGRGDAGEKERSPPGCCGASPPAAVSKGSARRHTIARLPFPWDLVIMLRVLIYSTCPLLFQGAGGDGSVLSVCFLCRLSSAHPRQKTVWEKHKSKSGHMYTYMENLNSSSDWQLQWKKKCTKKSKQAERKEAQVT